MTEKLYYTITNAKEKHNGFQYKDGLNVLEKEFDPSLDYCANELYFSDIEHIFDFIEFGIYVREITLPIDNAEFKIVRLDNKYRANMIILGKQYRLNNIETMKMLSDRGAKMNKDNLLLWSAQNCYWHLVKYFIDQGANIHANNDQILIYCVVHGTVKTIEYLIRHGIDIHANDDRILIYCIKNGSFEMVKYLIDNGANIHAEYDYALRSYAAKGDLAAVKYLVAHGADLHVLFIAALLIIARGEHDDLIEYLINEGFAIKE